MRPAKPCTTAAFPIRLSWQRTPGSLLVHLVVHQECVRLATPGQMPLRPSGSPNCLVKCVSVEQETGGGAFCAAVAQPAAGGAWGGFLSPFEEGRLGYVVAP